MILWPVAKILFITVNSCLKDHGNLSKSLQYHIPVHNATEVLNDVHGGIVAIMLHEFTYHSCAILQVALANSRHAYSDYKVYLKFYLPLQYVRLS